MFRTKYDRIKINCNHGSPIKYEYGAKLDKSKNVVIEKKGETNLYAYINSFADSVDINVLLARFTNGDKEALNQRAGSYIDISNIPTNLNEYLEFQRSTEALYNTLPAEVKAKFGNNLLQFISQVGEPEWNEIMNTSKDKIQKEIVEEAKVNTMINKEMVKPVIENPGLDPGPGDVVIDDPIDKPVLKGVKK